MTFNDLSYIGFDSFNKDTFDSVKNAFAYVASTNGFVLKVDVLRAEVILILKLHSNDVSTICICNENTMVATGGVDNYIKVWDNDLRELLLEIDIGYPINYIESFDKV